MLKKAKELYYKWHGKITLFWEDECYIRATLTFLLPPIFIALIIVLIIKAITAGFNFVSRYSGELIMAAIAICLFVRWLDKRKADNIEIERKEQEIRERRKYSDRFETVQMNNAKYVVGAKVIFTVAPELAALGIVPPAILSNIYSPGRTISTADGAVNFSLYLLQTSRESVDTDLLKNTLQTKIDQRLQAGDFPNIPESHIYKNRVYSGFVVHMIKESEGGFVEVYTALADDSYCRYCEDLGLNEYCLPPSVDRRDIKY